MDTCILNCNDQYALPTISFVGGETQDLSFNIYRKSKNNPFEMTGFESNFAVVSFLNRGGAPVISKPMTVIANSSGTPDSALHVVLSAAETAMLEGKYVYQVSIKDSSGVSEIPYQGIMIITRNINPTFVQ